MNPFFAAYVFNMQCLDAWFDLGSREAEAATHAVLARAAARESDRLAKLREKAR